MAFERKWLASQISTSRETRNEDNGGKMMFTIVDRQNDPDNGLVGSHTPLGQALMNAQKGDEVEYVIGSYVKKVRVSSVEHR